MAALVAVADRMAQAVKEGAGAGKAIVLGNGYGGFVALQMAIRHPGIASRYVFADCGAAFSEPGRQAFRNMAAAAQAKGLQAITDVAMLRLFAPEFQEANPDLMADRRAAFLKTDPDVFRSACGELAELDLRPELKKVTVPALVLVGEHDEATPTADVARTRRRPAGRAPEDTAGLRPRAATAIAGVCFWRRSAIFWKG